MPAASSSVSTPFHPSGPDAARRAHYGEFYGEATVGDGEAGRDGRPVLLAMGNCQAESLRAVLPGPMVHSIRTPPVHELTAADLPHLAAWLGRADLLVMQPIRDDYRGLPIGSDQLRSMLPARSRVAVVPVVRFAGLYPRHVIVRPPSDTSLVPPVVPYHDATVLLEAAGLVEAAGLSTRPLRPETVLAIRDESLAQLRRREVAHGTVTASDLFEHPRFDLMRTINHPGNPIWLSLAERVLSTLGVDAAPRDPGRPLLNSVHAPREDAVIEAFGLDDEPEPDWVLEGRRIGTEEVRRAHLAWYGEHPDAVSAGLERHATVLRMLAA